MPLENACLFQEVSESTRREIAAIATAEAYARGAFLFRAGDPARHLYLLRSGRLRLSIARGGLLSSTITGPGEALGWSSMAGNGAYTASVECLAPATVYKIPAEPLRRILERDPASGLTFYRRLARMIGRRLVASYGATLSMQSTGDPRSFG
jgi:CRP/FNR family transcriptional regulator